MAEVERESWDSRMCPLDDAYDDDVVLWSDVSCSNITHEQRGMFLFHPLRWWYEGRRRPHATTQPQSPSSSSPASWWSWWAGRCGSHDDGDELKEDAKKGKKKEGNRKCVGVNTGFSWWWHRMGSSGRAQRIIITWMIIPSCSFQLICRPWKIHFVWLSCWTLIAFQKVTSVPLLPWGVRLRKALLCLPLFFPWRLFHASFAYLSCMCVCECEGTG